jgi:hypothetical protein
MFISFLSKTQKMLYFRGCIVFHHFRCSLIYLAFLLSLMVLKTIYTLQQIKQCLSECIYFGTDTRMGFMGWRLCTFTISLPDSPPKFFFSVYASVICVWKLSLTFVSVELLKLKIWQVGKALKLLYFILCQHFSKW